MNNKKSYNTIYLIAGFILIGVFSRLIPHAPNFTAIGAVALFSGNYIKSQSLKYIIPIAAMSLSDIFLNLSGAPLPYLPVHISIYITFVLIVMIGSEDYKDSRFKKTPNIILSSLAASSLFFIITNFGVWLAGWYGYSSGGLATCYAAAVPFFGNTIIGDLTYCAILFGAYEYIKLQSPRLATN